MVRPEHPPKHYLSFGCNSKANDIHSCPLAIRLYYLMLKDSAVLASSAVL